MNVEAKFFKIQGAIEWLYPERNTTTLPMGSVNLNKCFPLAKTYSPVQVQNVERVLTTILWNYIVDPTDNLIYIMKENRNIAHGDS